MSTVLQMPINDNLSQAIADQLADEIKKTVLETVSKIADDIRNSDETMNKQEMCDKIFHCSPKTFDDSIFSSDFPFTETKGNRVYSKKAVLNWIEKHQVTVEGDYQWE